MSKIDYMMLAIEQAKRGGVATYQNPQVGAVLVKDHTVIASGYHHHFGGDHAEVDTLKDVPHEVSAGATLYVTLEPCSHFGKTPPCSHLIVRAGIRKVVIGQLDPNPLVSGKGRDYLQAHGVTVEDQARSEAIQLNAHYNWFYRQKRPWITLKYAMTLDGKINAHANQRSLISNQASYLDSQNLRAHFHAILIGEKTLTTDDPALTVRMQALTYPPVRLVVLTNSQVALNTQLTAASTIQTYLLCKSASSADAELRSQANLDVLIDDWTPAKIAELCVDHGWQSLLVEGGSHLHAAFSRAGLVDEIVTYLAPTVFGGDALPAIHDHLASSPLTFGSLKVTPLADNIKIQARRKES